MPILHVVVSELEQFLPLAVFRRLLPFLSQPRGSLSAFLGRLTRVECLWGGCLSRIPGTCQIGDSGPVPFIRGLSSVANHAFILVCFSLGKIIIRSLWRLPPFYISCDKELLIGRPRTPVEGTDLDLPSPIIGEKRTSPAIDDLN